MYQVKSEVTKRLKASKQALEDLGAKRQTPAEQYQYLTEISMEFQKIVGDALASNYGRYGLFRDRPSLRLVTAAVSRSETLAAMFAKYGHTYQYQGQSRGEEMEDTDTTSDTEIDGSDASASQNDPPAIQPSDQTSTSSVRLYPDLAVIGDLLPRTLRVAKPQREEVLNWLQSIYLDSRGYEIGTFNPTLLATIMKEQSRKWKEIALGYVADVIVLTHSFLTDLLQEVCPPLRVREGILALLMDPLCDRYKRAIQHVKFLLEVELNGTPSTLNHYFNDNLQKWYVHAST